jgi:soluble lytic murein transglycosylase-like protein
VIRGTLWVAAASLAAACHACSKPSSDRGRLELLGQAFALRAASPAEAARLCQRAGRGPALERVRVETWLNCLERGAAAPEAWQGFLDDRPPPDLAGQAWIGLARALMAQGNLTAAGAALAEAHATNPVAADEVLLTLPFPRNLVAAQRLSLEAPWLLQRIDPALEREVLASLSAEEWLERSRRWRSAGEPQRGLQELRPLRWRGENERRRRGEMAMAEIDAGAPQRALSLLPSVANSTAEELVIRASALRRQGWQRFPERSARTSFKSCLEAAERASLGLESRSEDGWAAAALVIECGTEAHQLDRALVGWRRLEAMQMPHPQREWLGRRLAVALAHDGRAAETLAIARALPEHERCLRFWAAVSAGDPLSTVDSLAAHGITDLYGLWIREVRQLEAPRTVDLAPPVGETPMPWSVSWLAERRATDDAMREWRRIRTARGALPAEAFTAARYEMAHGRINAGIAILRDSFPALGTVEMAGAPADVVHQYLPLRWPEAIKRAAREAGLDPWLLAGVARQESIFQERAVSPRNAIGVLQLLTATARGHARALGLAGEMDLRDPETNLRLGARELAYLIRRFDAIEPALAAYNAGQTRVQRWWREWPDRHVFTESVPIPETYHYVRRVRYLAEAYRLVYADRWQEER